MQVLHGALPVLLAFELRIMPEPELDRAPDDGLRLDLPVGLGDDPSVDAPRIVVERRPVILRSLRDGLNLSRVEPAGESGVLPDDAPRDEVVGLAVLTQSRVVEGRGGVNDVFVHRIEIRQGQRIADDALDMRAPVRLVEGVIAGQDLCFYVGLKLPVHVTKIRKSRHSGGRSAKILHLYTVKHRAFLLLLLLLCLPAAAGEPYFCTQTGKTLYYERFDASGGKLRRTTTMTVEGVKPYASGRKVVYSFVLRRPSGADMYGGPARMEAVIDADGTVRQDLGASLKSVLGNLLRGRELESSGSMALLPVDMKPGDNLPEAHCVVDALGAKYRIDVTERRVLRAERLTTPAGTFDCLVVREHKVERGPGRHRDTISDSWYVQGIGYVRHDTYDRNLRLETTEVLKKY